jgi:hypothetical protein
MATKYTFNISDSMIYELSRDIYNLYQMKDIVNYIHNGKSIPFKYEKLIERPISGIYSNIDGHISLQKLLTNTLRYCYTKPTNKNTQETKQLRETIMRIKLSINQLKQTNPTSPEILLKENEIELLNKKIEDCNNTIDNNNNIKNKYVNVAEATYNILIRKDNFPKYLYIEICNKLGVKINYEEHFIREYDNERISVIGGVIKKEYTNELDKEDAMIYKKSHQKATRYVPPCFRQEKTEESKQQDDEEINTEEINQKEVEVEKFPVLIHNKNIGTSISNSNVWNNKPKIIKEIQNNQIYNISELNITKTQTIDDEDDWSKY